MLQPQDLCSLMETGVRLRGTRRQARRWRVVGGGGHDNSTAVPAQESDARPLFQRRGE
jgi:hypothetical protein